MQDWNDNWLTGVLYDGMLFDVMFDEDDAGDFYPVEIASPTGETWTDQVSDLTKRRIYAAAETKRNAIAKDAAADYAGLQFDAMREAA